MLDRQEIKAGLTFGSQRKIARLSGLTEASVSQWFSGRINSERIAKAALTVYAQCVAARNEWQARLEIARKGEQL